MAKDKQQAEIETRLCSVRAENVLSATQLTALGKVAAEFGMLEAALVRHGNMLIQTAVPFPTIAGNPGGPGHAKVLI